MGESESKEVMHEEITKKKNKTKKHTETSVVYDVCCKTDFKKSFLQYFF